MVSINFRAKLGSQNAGNGISVLQISKFSGGVHPRPPHRKVPFQKMPPHGKILKKGPAISIGDIGVRAEKIT
jgi:hypothetical protein